ncbi:hypothetical protein SLS60_001608 [Paraconiothyrium brasiliense]|uniref:WHIM1 domain-containing protein n=1 Tax=Paraconiothyrium brasiliense TaxID=300254 RepID=A0ABR3S0C2_9PLEO
MQDRSRILIPDSSQDPPTAAGSYIALSDSTIELSVDAGRKRNSGAAEGESISSPSKTIRKLQPNTTSKAKRKLPVLSVQDFDRYVDKKWTVQDWMENVWDRSTVKQIDILCRLGLVAPGSTVKNYKGIFYFDDPLLTELSRAIHELSKTVHNASFDQIPANPLVRGRPRGLTGRKPDDAGRNAFVDAAKNLTHMNHQLNDLLCDRFGPKVWGMDVAARDGCTYRLELEDDADRPKIEALLHLWVFVKIANKCRDKRQKLHGSGRKSRAKKDLANMAGKALSLFCDGDNDTHDDDVDKNTPDVAAEDVEHEESEEQETTNTVDDAEAGLTTLKQQNDVKATRKRKRETETSTPSLRTEEKHGNARITASEDKATVDALSDEQPEDTSGPAPPKKSRRTAHNYMLTELIPNSDDNSHAVSTSPNERRVIDTVKNRNFIHWKEDGERVAEDEKSVHAGLSDGHSALAAVNNEQQVDTAGDDTSVNSPALATTQSSLTILAPINNSSSTTKPKLPDFHTFMKSIHGDLLAKRT